MAGDEARDMDSVGLSGILSRAASRADAALEAGSTPLPLRGASYTLIVLPLAELASPAFFARLREKIGQAPSFFEHAPVLIDLTGTSGGAAADFAELAARLGELRLVPVGVRGGDDDQGAAAAAAGLAVFPDFRQAGRAMRMDEEPAREPAPRQDMARQDMARQDMERPDAPRRTVTIDRPVRSGSQVYAEGADLIVLAPVGAGAELLADGNIHVYAPLRGRALAGVSGDRSARIFASRLEAELVSIAGLYRVNEDFADSARGRAVQIRLRGDALHVDPMD